MFVLFFYFKKLEFLFYSLYALALLLFITKDEWQVFENFLPNNILLKDWLLEISQIFIPLGYILFMIFYLNLKKDYLFAYKVLKISFFIYFSLLITDFLFYYFEYFLGHIYILQSFPVLAFITVTFSVGYIFIYNKNRISSLFILGSIFFMLGTGFYFYNNNESDPLFYNNKIYLIIGSSIEIIIFTFGLIYKIFSEYLDKLNFKQEAELNKNKALRAQINPHFIFNSLSSIQSFITSNDKVSALKYLSKFSRLTRNILESSIETNVVIEDEIKMLKDYLELESLRFDKAFSYKIHIDNAIDTNTVEVPFMILQPFVENAIIHGLLPKKEGSKVLYINFKKDIDFVICEIDDNGVGRKISSKKEHIHKNEKKSRGIEVTKQRLQTLSDHNDVIEIIDKVDSNDNALGTTIIIKIPI
jgi:sensor histidine kinase YesM